MLLLVQGAAQGAALVAEPGVRPGGVVVDGQDAAPAQEAFDGLEPAFAPAGCDRAVPDLGTVCCATVIQRPMRCLR